jgi:hypothetical protein
LATLKAVTFKAYGFRHFFILNPRVTAELIAKTSSLENLLTVAETALMALCASDRELERQEEWRLLTVGGGVKESQRPPVKTIA